MNPHRLRWYGDAFALFAFVTPLLCLALAAFILWRGQWLASETPRGIIAWLNGCCVLGGAYFLLRGRKSRIKRLSWQGAFGLVVGLTLTVLDCVFIGWMSAY